MSLLLCPVFGGQFNIPGYFFIVRDKDPEVTETCVVVATWGVSVPSWFSQRVVVVKSLIYYFNFIVEYDIFKLCQLSKVVNLVLI